MLDCFSRKSFYEIINSSIYMKKFEKIPVEGEKHSFNVVCLKEEPAAQIKEHNNLILDKVQKEAKRNERKKFMKIAALFLLLSGYVLLRFFW